MCPNAAVKNRTVGFFYILYLLVCKIKTKSREIYVIYILYQQHENFNLAHQALQLTVALYTKGSTIY